MANNINITINFDMDGTIADLYGEENWLDDLINERTTPYANAKPLDILFDDEEKNRNNWTGRAYDVENILEILKKI